MKKFILSLTLILAAFLANAQVYFKNNYSEPLWVAVGYYVDASNFKGWKTTGWFKVIPGAKVEVLPNNSFNQKMYYYAQTEGAALRFEGNYLFLVDPVNAFNILNADKEYVQKENSNYKWYKFREIDKGKINALKLKYTIEFNYYDDAKYSGDGR